MTRQTPQWLQAGNYSASADRRLIGALWPAAASQGCAVTVAGGNMNVNIAPGTVAVPTQNSTGTTLCTSDAVEVVTVATAPGSGSNRIDIVTCQPRGNDLDLGTNNDFIFTTVTGTVAATPAAPAVPAGAVGLAQVYVTGGSAALVAGNLTDVRPGLLPVARTDPGTIVGQRAFVIYGGWGSTASTTFVPLGASNTPHVKKFAGTNLRIQIGCSCWVTGTAGQVVETGFSYDGTAGNVVAVAHLWFDATGTHRHWTGMAEVTGRPAGAFTGSWWVRTGAAVQTINNDASDIFYGTVTEVWP
jgi:hypothetical protein